MVAGAFRTLKFCWRYDAMADYRQIGYRSLELHDHKNDVYMVWRWKEKN